MEWSWWWSSGGYLTTMCVRTLITMTFMKAIISMTLISKTMTGMMIMMAHMVKTHIMLSDDTCNHDDLTFAVFLWPKLDVENTTVGSQFVFGELGPGTSKEFVLKSFQSAWKDTKGAGWVLLGTKGFKKRFGKVALLWQNTDTWYIYIYLYMQILIYDKILL